MLPLLTLALLSQQNPAGLALPKTSKVTDAVQLSVPRQVKLGGILGERYAANAKSRLPYVDEDELLAGFRSKPGKQPWIGEHVGKWLHASSLTYAATKDPILLAKLKRVAGALMATQEPDGYMGTYAKGTRFSMAPNTGWDVWVHKYCLLGLLSYFQVTHDSAALEGCKRIGDLLIRTFHPGGQTFNKAGEHMGMAATSVLEPVVMLYRATQDPRYLAFGKYIVESFEEPGGSRLEHDLLTKGNVAESANGKAYEMLSNLVGLTELYRVTGDSRYLKPVRIAWSDIVRNRLYLTGTGSSMEHWTKAGKMPYGPGDNVGETCVTVSWMQLNVELLRLTGDSKYMDQLERSTYNHLLGSQRADGKAWCYYNPLQGVRNPGSETNCCLSSGPRGIALLPTFAYASNGGGVDVNLYGNSTYHGSLDLRQEGDYPFSPDISLTVEKGSVRPETIRLRIPAWAARATVSLGRKPLTGAIAGTFLSVRRRWKAGDRLRLHLPMQVRTIEGFGNTADYRAYAVGPLIYAADYAQMSISSSKERVGVNSSLPKPTGRGKLVVDGFTEAPGYAAMGGHPALRRNVTLLPFFQAGTGQTPYTVWLLKRPSPPFEGAQLTGALESASRVGNVLSSFTDGDATTLTNTYTNTRADDDWFALAFPNPILVSRIEFRHGQSYHDGGWFDTSSGRPVVQVLRSKGGEWESVGSLGTYPVTTAESAGSIETGQAFSVRIQATRIWGIRIVGKPSHGDRPAQNFSSCAEIAAFEK